MKRRTVRRIRCSARPMEEKEMARFCTSCGAPLNENAEFCTACGAAQAPASKPQDGAQAPAEQGGMNMNNFTEAAGAAAQNAAEKVKNTFGDVSVDSLKGAMNVDSIKNVGKTKDKNVIIVLCAAVVLLILIIIIAVSALGGGYKKPVDNLLKGISNADGKTVLKAFPEFYVDSIEDQMDDAAKDKKKYKERLAELEEDKDYYDADEYAEMYKSYQDRIAIADCETPAEYFEKSVLEDLRDELEDEYGENIKISYKIRSKKELKKSDLNDMEDYVEAVFDEEVKIKKGYELKLKMKIKGKDDKDEEKGEISVYKIDGKWYILGMDDLDLG